MQFNVLAVLSSLLIVSSAAAIEQRQIDETNYCDRYNDLDIAVTFPHETLWGDYKLCCNYLGPNSQDTVSRVSRFLRQTSCSVGRPSLSSDANHWTNSPDAVTLTKALKAELAGIAAFPLKNRRSQYGHRHEDSGFRSSIVLVDE
ncbi:hypothetical protein IAQ61_008098 [Plenodomus lingam]|uniref:uncharacterized protein n=1 Tax=Leptosphaeria maculans TaxID=5022 RepID=UPI00332E3756|nr:hypothetical protein IAQ61_008098 [Plenodomus lingam]